MPPGYIGNYQGSYGPGSSTNRFFPALGNHDITDGGGLTAYLNYFTLPGAGIPTTNTSGNERYYDFIRGPVHFFVVNSDPSETNGRTSTSTQATWLRTQLAASTSPWKIVYMHHPPYSSGSTHGSEVELRWPYEAWGATAVISGHDHIYERVIRDDNSDGVKLSVFRSGNRGARPLQFYHSCAGKPGANSANYGAQFIEADNTNITFEFSSIAGGGTLIDTFTINNQVAAPTITTQPANQTVNEGETATFSVAASGTAPLNYQWEWSYNGGSSWTPVGTNSASYTMTSDSSDNGALCRCVATNTAGNITSTAATLTVTAQYALTVISTGADRWPLTRPVVHTAAAQQFS